MTHLGVFKTLDFGETTPVTLGSSESGLEK
jgi:hypothetical protein